MSYLPSSPILNSLAGILTKYPRRGVLLFKLLADIDGSCSPLGKSARELILSYASGLNHCDFYINTRKAKQGEGALDVDEGLLDALHTDIDSANVDEKLKPVLRFVKKLTLSPSDITAEDAQQIFAAGWDEPAFLESVCLCAIANCMDRFVMGIGADATELNFTGRLGIHPHLNSC